MTGKSARRYLVAIFIRNGNARVKDSDRARKMKSDYRKGYEIRFIARNKMELKKIQEALGVINIRYGKYFPKVNCFVQPVYGKKFTLYFLDLVNRSA